MGFRWDGGEGADPPPPFFSWPATSIRAAGRKGILTYKAKAILPLCFSGRLQGTKAPTFPSRQLGPTQSSAQMALPDL